jgi:hypothetical protein
MKKIICLAALLAVSAAKFRLPFLDKLLTKKASAPVKQNKTLTWPNINIPLDFEIEFEWLQVVPETGRLS